MRGEGAFVAGFLKGAARQITPEERKRRADAVARGALTGVGIGAATQGLGLLALHTGKSMTGDEWKHVEDLGRAGKFHVASDGGLKDTPYAVPEGFLSDLALPSAKGKSGIHVPRKSSFEVALHEAGHVMSEFKTPLRRAISKSTLLAAPALGVATPFVAYKGYEKAIKDPESASMVPLALLATNPITYRLPGEAMASTWALAHLKKTRGLGAALKAAPRLGAAFGTYLGVAALPAVAFEVFRRKLLNRKGKSDGK